MSAAWFRVVGGGGHSLFAREFMRRHSGMDGTTSGGPRRGLLSATNTDSGECSCTEVFSRARDLRALGDLVELYGRRSSGSSSPCRTEPNSIVPFGEPQINADER